MVAGVDKIMNNVRRSTNFAHAKGKFRNLQHIDAGINDVFTEADVHIQNTIVYNLK